MNHHALAIVFAVVMLAAGSAAAQDVVSRTQKNQSIAIHYGKVTAVDAVKLDSGSKGGAVLGGMVGLAASHGSSHNSDRVAATAGGALLGALLTRAAEGTRKAEAFTVQQNDGDVVKVIQDLADIQVGDCVCVEQGQTANIRRVSDAMCENGPHLNDASIATSHSQDAEECAMAKREVLNAKSDADFARADRKVQILCN